MLDGELHIKYWSYVFKDLVIMKSTWGPDLYNMAAQNNQQFKEVDYFDFEELLVEKMNYAAWDKLDDSFEFQV